MPQKAAQVILICHIGFPLMMALGIKEAARAIIGNCISANNAQIAKLFFAQLIKIRIAITLMLG